MSGDFNWNSEDNADSIILSYQPPTAVYSTNGGGVCVRQKADEMEEYDPQILLTPQGALAVAWALIEEAHLVGLPEPSLSLMAEGPHWPPVIPKPKQKRATATPEPGKDGGPLLAAMGDGGGEAPLAQRGGK